MLLVPALSACHRPRLYGPVSCNGEAQENADGQRIDDLIALPNAAGNIVVCLPRAQAVFITCVRELARSKVIDEHTRDVGLEVKVEKVDVDSKLTVKTSDKLEQMWESEGVLAKARAATILACINMLPEPDKKAIWSMVSLQETSGNTPVAAPPVVAPPVVAPPVVAPPAPTGR
jgi:hypothetical protein